MSSTSCSPSSSSGGGGWAGLHVALHTRFAEKCDEKSRLVLAQVHPALRAAVALVRERDGPAGAPRVEREEVCSSVELLAWAVSEQGCPLDTTTSWAAARGGHLACLQWLKEQGCPCNQYTCYAAAG